jgi:hypothetical protein
MESMDKKISEAFKVYKNCFYFVGEENLREIIDYCACFNEREAQSVVNKINLLERQLKNFSIIHSKITQNPDVTFFNKFCEKIRLPFGLVSVELFIEYYKYDDIKGYQVSGLLRFRKDVKKILFFSGYQYKNDNLEFLIKCIRHDFDVLHSVISYFNPVVPEGQNIFGVRFSLLEKELNENEDELVGIVSLKEKRVDEIPY